MLSHIFATFLLAFVCIYAASKGSELKGRYLKWLWWLIVGLIGVTSIGGFLYAIHLESVLSLLQLIKHIEVVMGCLLLAIFCWAILYMPNMGLIPIGSGILLGVYVLYYTFQPQWSPLESVFQSFCLIVAMSTAALGMIRRNRMATWLVLGLMFIAFSLKAQHMTNSFIHPFDLEQYLKGIGLFIIVYGFAPKVRTQRS